MRFSNHLPQNVAPAAAATCHRTLKNGHPGDEGNTTPLLIQGVASLTCAAPLCRRAELQLNDTFSVRKFQV
jgi:hypothetical protein